MYNSPYGTSLQGLI